MNRNSLFRDVDACDFQVIERGKGPPYQAPTQPIASKVKDFPAPRFNRPQGLNLIEID
jgi:hypothetical protein